MKSFMISALSRSCPRQFISVRIFSKEIIERVILKNGSCKIDISEIHCIVCQKPLQIAIFIAHDTRDLFFNSDKIDINVERGSRQVTSMQFSLVKDIQIGTSTIVILKAIKAQLFHANFFFTSILLKRFQNQHKYSLSERTIIAALFSYPRNIVLVSFMEGECYNIFPMDFHCISSDNHIHLFGLRATNITLNKIISVKKLVVSDTDNVSLENVYFLGSHHSKNPAKIETLPFSVIHSEIFNFPVPSFTSSYSEIELISSELLGSHVLLVGKEVNRFRGNRTQAPLHHVHYFQFINSGYNEEM